MKSISLGSPNIMQQKYSIAPNAINNLLTQQSQS